MNLSEFPLSNWIAETNQLFNYYSDLLGCTCRHMLWFIHSDAHELEQRRASISQCGVMWCLRPTSLPLLFVLITERFTLLYWPISYCDCKHRPPVAVLNWACTLDTPPTPHFPPANPLSNKLCTLYMSLLCPPLLFTRAITCYLPHAVVFVEWMPFIVTFSLRCCTSSSLSLQWKKRKSEIRISNQSKLSCSLQSINALPPRYPNLLYFLVCTFLIALAFAASPTLLPHLLHFLLFSSHPF